MNQQSNNDCIIPMDYIENIISNECPICLEKTDTHIDLCSCGVKYHEKCWITWVINNKTCPTCRKKHKLNTQQYYFAIENNILVPQVQSENDVTVINTVIVDESKNMGHICILISLLLLLSMLIVDDRAQV